MSTPALDSVLQLFQRSPDTEIEIQNLEASANLDIPKRHEMAKSGTSSGSLNRANAKRKLTKQQAFDMTLQLVTSDPTLTPLEIANRIGKSRQTVYDYLDELERMRRNRTGMVPD